MAASNITATGSNTPANDGSGLITNAMNTTTPGTQTTAVDPSVSTNPTTPNVTQAGAVTGAVDPNKGTVQGQLGSMLDSGSPYLQAAGARSSEASNDRGLVNSTMGVQAGQTAAIDAALPIAQSDAGAYNTQSLTNQQAENSTNQFNATAKNNNAQAGYSEAANLASIGAQKNSTIDTQNNQGNINAGIQNMQDQSAQLTNTNTTAAQIYQQSQTAISNIMTNQNLTPAQKQNMIASETSLMNAGLSVIDAVNKGTLNTNLQNLLNFNTSGVGG